MRVEPHLLVRELDPPFAVVVPEQRPQDPARDALDEVVAVEEGAAVDREEAHVRTRATTSVSSRARRRACGRRRLLAALAPRSTSIALATIDATTVSIASSASVNATVSVLSTTSTPTSWPRASAGTATRLSASASPGTGISRPGPICPWSSNERRTVRPYLRHLAEVADPDRRGTSRGHADDAFADHDLGPDAFVGIAVARDRVEPPPLLVEEQEERVLVAEQLGEAVDRRGHDACRDRRTG